jgi:hypothetical protein
MWRQFWNWWTTRIVRQTLTYGQLVLTHLCQDALNSASGTALDPLSTGDLLLTLNNVTDDI